MSTTALKQSFLDLVSRHYDKGHAAAVQDASTGQRRAASTAASASGTTALSVAGSAFICGYLDASAPSPLPAETDNDTPELKAQLHLGDVAAQSLANHLWTMNATEVTMTKTVHETRFEICARAL